MEKGKFSKEEMAAWNETKAMRFGREHAQDDLSGYDADEMLTPADFPSGVLYYAYEAGFKEIGLGAMKAHQAKVEAAEKKAAAEKEAADLATANRIAAQKAVADKAAAEKEAADLATANRIAAQKAVADKAAADKAAGAGGAGK